MVENYFERYIKRKEDSDRRKEKETERK